VLVRKGGGGSRGLKGDKRRTLPHQLGAFFQGVQKKNLQEEEREGTEGTAVLENEGWLKETWR